MEFGSAQASDGATNVLPQVDMALSDATDHPANGSLAVDPDHNSQGKAPLAGECSDANGTAAGDRAFMATSEGCYDTFVFVDRGAWAGQVHAIADVDAERYAIGYAHSGEPQGEPTISRHTQAPIHEHDLPVDGSTGAPLMHPTPNATLHGLVKGNGLDHLTDQFMSSVAELF